MYNMVNLALSVLAFMFGSYLCYWADIPTDQLVEGLDDPANKLDSSSWIGWIAKIILLATILFLLTVIAIQLVVLWGDWMTICVCVMLFVAPYAILERVFNKLELIEDLSLRWLVIATMSGMFGYLAINYPGEGTRAAALFLILAFFLLAFQKMKLRPLLLISLGLMAVPLIALLASRAVGESITAEFVQTFRSASEQFPEQNVYLDSGLMDKAFSGLLVMIAFRQYKELGIVALPSFTIIGYVLGEILFILLGSQFIMPEMFFVLGFALIGYFSVVMYKRLWSQIVTT